MYAFLLDNFPGNRFKHVSLVVSMEDPGQLPAGMTVFYSQVAPALYSQAFRIREKHSAQHSAIKIPLRCS